MLFEADFSLNSADAEQIFAFSIISGGVEGADPCLAHAVCDFCADNDACQEKKGEYAESTYEHMDPIDKYGAEVEYSCSPGMKFRVPDPDNDTLSTLEDSFTIKCDWEKNWQPRGDLPPCEC